MYIYDLPMKINFVSETILFADDTSVIVPNRKFEYYFSVSNLFLSYMIKLFAAAAATFVLNLAKTNKINFITKN
jgi:hypothetical protein